MPDDPSLSHAAAYLDGMGRVACSVSVITTDGAQGRFGVTVSAVSSVSTDGPFPTLLACIHHMSPAAEPLIESGIMCVNVLRAGQSTIADVFAGRLKDRFPDKFSCAAWTKLQTGAPVLEDALVSFDCRIVDVVRRKSHFVLYGDVLATLPGSAGAPLVHVNRSYAEPRPLALS